MPTSWDDFEPVTEEPSASTNWSDFEAEAPAVPKIKLDPYQQYRLSGREPVAGPFGPAHPEEVLSLAEAAQRPIIPLPDTQAKGPLAAAYRSVVKPVIEGIESPAGILMAPALAESVPLRIAAGAAFGGLAAKSGIEKMQSDDPQTQLEGRMELAGSPLLALLPGGRDKVAGKVTERPQVNLERPPISPENPLPEAPKLQGEEREFQILRENWLPTIKGWRREMLNEEVAKGQGTHNIETNMEDSPGAQDVTRAKRYYELARKLYGRVEGEEIPPATPTPKLPPEPISEQAPSAPEPTPVVEAKPKSYAQRMAEEFEAEMRRQNERAKRPKTKPTTTLPELVKNIGTDELNGLIANWDQNAELHPSGKYITTLSDPRSGTGRSRASTKDFLSWYEEQKAPPSFSAGEAQPSAAPGGATVETPVSAGETPQAKGEVATVEPPTQEPSVTPPVTEPPIQGMGGAVPAEFEVPQGTPTSTKNAVVDQERVKRGLPEAFQPARREFGKVWDSAMAKIDRDPEYPDNLIEELDKRPRAATDEENAVLLHRQVDLQNEYAKATRDLAQAFEDGRQEAVDAEKVRVSNLSDQLLRVYNVGKKVGTETGRGLNARKMLANEDFTLAKMTMDQRAAQGGRPLSPEQVLEIQRLHDKINATQAAFDEHVAKSRVKISDLQKQLDDELQAQLSAEQKAGAKQVRTAFSKLSPEEKVTATVDAIKQRVADKKPDEISFFVQRLARDLVARGVRNRDKLIDAVHEVLQQAIPEITKRQTMDAISGYGDFKQLSKDEISVALRGMKGEMQQLAKLEDMAKGEPPLKSGTERRTPTEAERALIKEVNEAKFKFQVPVQDPSTQLKSALDTLKTTLTNRIKDYEDRIAKGDYSARPKRELVLDPEASRLKAQNERVKKEFQKGVELERFKNAQPFERGAHWINRWTRGFLLSGPAVLGKLTAAALERMAFTPVEEGAGAGIGAAFPELAKRATREGGFSPSAETLAITRGITQGAKDAWDLLRTGKSDLDAVYGKVDALPGSFMDFFGRVHGMLKAPVKRAEFTRSLQKRIEWGKKNGVDVTDPWVQMKMETEAYKDANRSIFMQDNRLVSGYKRMIQGWEQKNKVTGKVPFSGKALSTAARIAVPIVKVPTNIVAETLQYALGSIPGGINLAKAYAKGIENLKPEEADIIMRQLKKGSIGAATLALGYFSPNVFGGYYQKWEKRKPGEPAVASIKVPVNLPIFGHNIPSFLLHNPLLETLQLGATIRRVKDAHVKKGEGPIVSAGEGLYAGATGVTEETPFVREMLDFVKAWDPNQKTAFIGEFAKSRTIPNAVSWAAQHYDTDSKGNPIKRAPKTIVQHIETGIPGLREKVPKKKGQ